MPSKCYEFKNLGLRTNFETSKYSKAKNIRDRKFENRVREYIKENKHKTFLDSDTLVDSLRRKYPEYMRRQRTAIKNLAGQVIAKLTEETFESDAEKDMAEEPVGSENEDSRSNLSNISSDDELSATNNVTASINNTLADLYKTSSSTPGAPQNEEFINISSDENIEEEESSSSSCSTITIDGDQGNNSEKSVPASSMKKRKLLETPETPNTEKASTNGSVKSERKRFKGTPNSRQRIKKPDPEASKQKKQFSLDETIPVNNIPGVSFADVAGYQHVISEIVQLVVHIYHPEVYDKVGIDPPRGFLLHGPPGCGKTLLAHAVAGELKMPLLDVAAPELVAGVSGISEQRIRKLFENAVKSSPCVLFIDEIDCITQNRDIANRDMERRIVSQLLSSIDKLNRDPKGAQVLLIGATNRPDSLDPALRRAGRFDREVCMGIPNKESRHHILRFLCSKLRLAEDICLREVASHTPGYVGADLLALIRESALSAVHRIMENVPKPNVDDSCSPKLNADDSCSDIKDIPNNESTPLSSRKTDDVSSSIKSSLLWIRNKLPISEEYLKDLCIIKDDITLSLKRVQPSSKREGFATVPDVTWDDVGSLKDVREDLQLAILAPVKFQKHFDALGLPLSMGVLLCGPPGCGKTLLAKAVANEAGINFISVKGPELLNMYVGGSEKAVRECFQRAKNSQPCVIFFDELDALCPKRSDHSDNSAGMRVVNQLLTEMDGVEGRTGVFLMAATNRPDIIDPAVLRPGRLDKILYVGFPNENDRHDILLALTKNRTKPPLHDDVDLMEIAKNPLCEGFTGADLAALVRDASVRALSELITSGINDTDIVKVLVTAKHFEQALHNLRPSVSEKDRAHYNQLRLKFATSAYHLQKKE